MTNPFTPRLEQLRALLDALAGAPDANLRQMQTALEALAYTPGGEDPNAFPPAGLAWPPLFYLQLAALLDAYGTSSANQAQADEAARDYLPLLGGIDGTLASLLIVTTVVRDALYHNPGGGAPVEGAVDVLREVRGLLDDILLSTVTTNSRLETANATLAALLECCQNGGGGDPDAYTYAPDACSLYPLQFPATNAVSWFGGTDTPRQYGITLNTAAGGLGGVGFSSVTGTDFTIMAVITGSSIRQACIARATNDRYTDGYYRVLTALRAPGDGPPAGMAFMDTLKVLDFDNATLTDDLLMAPPDEFGRYRWYAFEHVEDQTATEKTGAPGLRVSLGAQG